MKLNIIEKYYYEIEIDDAENFEDAKQKFYANQSKIMDEQVPCTSNAIDYDIEVYDSEWCD